jgi:hypothetical protein
MNGETDETLNEPRRLADAGARPSAQMIRAIRQIDASQGARQRLLRRVRWLSLVSLFSSNTRDAAAALSAKSLTLLAGVGVAVGVGAYALKVPSSSPPVALSAPLAAPVVSAPPPAAAPNEPAAEEGVEGAREQTSVVVTRKAGTPRKPVDPLLSEEIKLFDSARTAVRNAQARQALLRLDEYAEGFPNGRFSLEASALRIEALAALGKRAQARALAQRFIARHPESLLVERVRPHAAGP